MSKDLFKTGGPYNIRKEGQDQYRFTINVPTDELGMAGRECPRGACAPAYFKVKPGTGITENHQRAYCPYCREEGEPTDFTTQAQVEHGKNILKREALKGVGEYLSDSLGLDRRGRREFGGGLLSMTMEMKPPQLPSIGRPIEEELRRDLYCPNCTLAHAVFGLATWCPDCGADIFPSHVAEELDLLRKVLADVEERKKRLGPRLAARDIENTLEDLVSLVEVVLKILTKRHLVMTGMEDSEADDLLRRRVRNAYQNLDRAAKVFPEQTGVELRNAAISPEEFERLAKSLQKRHPITHNLGVVDRQYLERASAGGLVGQEIRVTQQEVQWAIDKVEILLAKAHERLFVTGKSEDG